MLYGCFASRKSQPLPVGRTDKPIARRNRFGYAWHIFGGQRMTSILSGTHDVKARRASGTLKAALLGIATLIGLAATAPALATIDPAHQFITNGDFELTTNGIGQLNYNTNAVGWTNANEAGGAPGYNFIFSGATATSTGANGDSGNVTLWGPGSGVNNGFVASPTGGNFIGADGAYQVARISQQISGLIVGQSYSLTFNWAGAQQKNFDGATTESWKFGLTDEGLSSQTAILNDASHGFTGWQTQTYNFVASKASDTLYFLAAGTPSGQPPFSLLDSVSLTGAFVSAAPEASTWEMLILGFGIVGFSLRKRRRSAVAALQIA